jgi:two-component system chemotaxis response regulator CheY
VKTVMIADDSLFMRTRIKQIIEQDHYCVIAEAKDGVEAISHFEHYAPDIVLLDLTMPNVDGLTALKEIMKVNKDAKVIIFSALATKYSILEALRLGAKDFIVKPYFDQLTATLKKLFLWKFSVVHTAAKTSRFRYSLVPPRLFLLVVCILSWI